VSKCGIVLALEGRTDVCQTRIAVGCAVIAGWTGRDATAVQRHIEELAKLGVPRPRSVPTFYRVAANRITTASCIEVVGERTSGEVEFVLMQWDEELWVGVGSDHTDRAVETFDVGASKQMCDKPVAPRFWRFADVMSHWQQLRLRSYIGPERLEYQAGSVAAMLDPARLISAFCGASRLKNGTLMFCGTLPALGDVRPGSPFTFEIADPVLKRTIQHTYLVESLNERIVAAE
jgi:uncharacterized protein DUF2848